jgi:hypothetical protein
LFKDQPLQDSIFAVSSAHTAVIAIVKIDTIKRPFIFLIFYKKVFLRAMAGLWLDEGVLKSSFSEYEAVIL